MSLNGMIENFINETYEEAIKQMLKHKIPASVTLAQCILESNWGRSLLALNANNYFGIKGQYNGKSYTVETEEYINGQSITVLAEFKSYPSMKESFEDHSQFLLKSRYKEAFKYTDYSNFIKEIWKGGYATDPKYPEKIISIIRNNDLHIFDNPDSLYSYEKVKEEIKLDYRVAIDCGHGGFNGSVEDPGAVGQTGLREVDVVAKIGKFLSEELNGQKINNRIMKRNWDLGAITEESDNYLNGADKAVFVSLHNNAAENRSAMGIETFYNSNGGNVLAKYIQDSITNEVKSYYGDKASYVNRGITLASFYVIKNTADVAVLVENCFISNSFEEGLLKKDEFLKSLAKGICKGICGYFELKYKDSSAVEDVKPSEKVKLEYSMKKDYLEVKHNGVVTFKVFPSDEGLSIVSQFEIESKNIDKNKITIRRYHE